MTTEEKIQELAHILAEVISMVDCALPHNYKAYLHSLQERAEELSQSENL